jgi:hypothetical protein
MPDYDRLFNVQMNKRLVHEFSLSGRCPTLRSRSVCVTEARTIDGDDAKSLGQPFEYPANFEVLQHGAITVQQDEGRPFASLYVMKADPVDIKEAAEGWVVPLRQTCSASVHQSHGSEDGCRG